MENVRTRDLSCLRVTEEQENWESDFLTLLGIG